MRRALLDESTKKLTAWSNHTRQELSKRLRSDQERLLSTVNPALKPKQDVLLIGSASEQMNALKALKTASRNGQINKTRQAIQKFTDKLAIEEQPYQRVRDLVETARIENTVSTINPFEFDSTELQLQEHLQATNLLIRCHLIILSDIISMHEKTIAAPSKGILKVDFDASRKLCETVIEEADNTANSRQGVDGRIFWAKFAAMECGTLDVSAAQEESEALQLIDTLKDAAFEHMQIAENACPSYQDRSRALRMRLRKYATCGKKAFRPAK